MDVSVRIMDLDEVGLIIDYFHRSTPEHLKLLGVDPTRLPPQQQWLDFYRADFSRPAEQRKSLLVIWQDGHTPIGFSSTDRIVSAAMLSCICTSSTRGTGSPAPEPSA